ncbi:transcriptional regulator [Candidatus Bathyarchaeota archaeon]|nr:transcriptional regulator [Candidatus Bathyarchaeota archaeon]
MAAKTKSSTLNTKLLLTRLVDALSQVNAKLDSIIELNGKILKMQEEFLQRITNKSYPMTELKLEPDALSLLSLPMSLRKTVMVLYKLEKATANDLANETKRLRAVESASANQLVRMGYLKKRREGREVYFYIESPMEMRK